MSFQSFIRLMEASPSGLMLLNDRLYFEAVNETAARIFGYATSELEGQHLHLLIPVEYRQQHSVHEKSFTSNPTHQRMGGSLTARTFKSLKKDGSFCELEVGLNPSELDGKRVFVLSVSDRTELIDTQRHLEQSNLILQKQNSEIQSLHDAQKHFLSVLSHELKTPSHGALQQIKLLEEAVTKVQPELLEPLQDLEVATREVVRCIRSLMDYADVTNSEFSINPEPVGLLQLIDQRLKTLRLQYRSYHGQLNCRCGFVGSPVLLVDQVRLRRMIFGIAANSILHGKPKVIDIQIDLDTSSIQSMLSVTISDDGQGISESLLKTITHKPMVNAQERKSKGGGGLGMSLYLFRNYLDEMGGKLHIQSDAGRGTTVSFSLPVTILSVKPPAAESAMLQPAVQADKPMAGLRFLIVEDEPMVAKVTRKLLANRGAEAVIASNGAEALDILKWPASNRFDAVLMDLDMPVMNGFDATRAIREIELLKHLPIYAVTAGKEGEAFPKALACGMNACFSKPFDPDSLQMLFCANQKLQSSESSLV